MAIETADITGLVLAGGRGSRMGGVDKGLQVFGEEPLAARAARRLRPQVGALLINANRNLETYRALGFPVLRDADPEYPGPLAGILAGLTHCRTDYLVSVPCDTPNFPADLVMRLAVALEQGAAEIAIAVTRDGDARRPQPVFCLTRRSLAPSLQAFIASGQRKMGLWPRQHRLAEVLFEDDSAFLNVNTLDELAQAQQPAR